MQRQRTRKPVPLGSASYAGNIFGNVWNLDDPNRNTGLNLLRGTLALDANLDSVLGFTGNMLGAFHGPAGEEIGGVWRGHRDATATTPEQLINGFFSGGREPDAEQ